MATFDFEALKKKANEVADKGVNLAIKAAGVAKTKAKIAKLKTEIIGEKERARQAYQEIGKIYYHLHKDAPEEELVTAVADLELVIDNLKAKYAAIQKLRTDEVEPAEDENAAVVVESVIPQTEEEIEEAIFTDVDKAVDEPAEETEEAVEEEAAEEPAAEDETTEENPE
jgi:hypothetical protein